MTEIHFIIYNDNREFIYEAKLRPDNIVKLPACEEIDYNCCKHTTCCNYFSFQAFKESKEVGEPGSHSSNDYVIQYVSESGSKQVSAKLDTEVSIKPKLNNPTCTSCFPFCFVCVPTSDCMTLKIKLTEVWEQTLPIHKEYSDEGIKEKLIQSTEPSAP